MSMCCIPWCVLSRAHCDMFLILLQFLMLWYHLCLSDNKHSIGHAWHLMGFVAKLAQGVSYWFLYYWRGTD